MTDDVLITVEDGVGRLRLNRPKAIHALTTQMCEAMSAGAAQLARRRQRRGGPDRPCRRPRLLRRRRRRHARAQRQRRTSSDAKRFFFAEYRLNHLLFTYPKPTIAIMDGITMGGGVGISLPCDYRIATENTRLAMPETGIGLFPDVGGGWYLSRLPGRVGQYMVLTGARLDGAECHYLQLATHYVEQSALEELVERIMKAPTRVQGAIGAAANSPAGMRRSSRILPQISRLFASDRLEDMLRSARGGRERMGAERAGDAPHQEPAVVQGLAAAAGRRREPRQLRRRDARRICARRPRGPHPRLPRGRARAADRQDKRPAMGPGDAGGGHRRNARRAVRAAAPNRGMDAVPGGRR